MSNSRVCFFCRKPIPKTESRCNLCYETLAIGKVTKSGEKLEYFSHREPNRSVEVEQAFTIIENWNHEKGNYIAFIRSDGICVQMRKGPDGFWDIFFPGDDSEEDYSDCTTQQVSRFFSLFASYKNWRWLFNGPENKSEPPLLRGPLFSRDKEN